MNIEIRSKTVTFFRKTNLFTFRFELTPFLRIYFMKVFGYWLSKFIESCALGLPLVFAAVVGQQVHALLLNELQRARIIFLFVDEHEKLI